MYYQCDGVDDVDARVGATSEGEGLGTEFTSFGMDYDR